MVEGLIAVELDPYLEDRGEGYSSRIPSKWISEDFLGDTYRNLFKFMSNKNPDANNSEGYNAQQKQVIEMVDGWVRESSQNPDQGRVDYGFVPNDNTEYVDLSSLEGGLDREIRNDTDRSIHLVNTEVDGQDQEVRTIMLWVQHYVPGGNI